MSHQDSTNRIQVSSQRSPKFYTNLSKRFLSSNATIEISGLGTAISTAVAASEMLRQQGYASIKSIETSSVKVNSGNEASVSSGATKPKIMIVMERCEGFEERYEKEQKEFEEKKKEREQQGE